MPMILVVDDDAQVRDMLTTTLEREGYEVCEASDGAEAVEVYDPMKVDLVITDIVMPEKEGIETIMDIRGKNPQAPIIAISGGGRINPEDYLHWARRLGVTCTFTKPVDRRQLLDAIEMMLSKESV